ncbi:RIIA lysis inhibitor [Roseobacter phage RD-1410W1-01]|uniref:RIIA-like protein n=1 Tax=Roseobacter phage RD-1410W1-01 TaxID=1815984 RepID=A0A191VYJ5_9CAUD|nr:RIIA lysis inhibitor [Roseobacter phage RD-1410W1-01]ANJ20781.1 rIIA-like protein [Roseobacter phage RD-1410W1-01]
MQVMNTAEFEQKEVLLGQQGKTESFGVSDDAALMSMLSTGLYANPLRTMIQEIIFNAWDAHRMGNCQDTTPIDIHLNDTTGLIVRDYGPGIHPDDMVPIYCIYGNSTKRDDKGSTGGFGLGSKSPFAYTESFTVTSFHNKTQNMYLISRASDDNDGRPGLTKIIDGVPSEECGLLVTVPIKNDRDLELAYNHLKELLKFSGIWAKVHYLDNDVEEIKAEKVDAGRWELDEDSDYSIYAQYGGVSYAIESRDEYAAEFDFIYRIARTCQAKIRIGFAPDSLTPLPNREGLNFSERTVETIKSQLETMVEFYKSHVKPAMRLAMECGIRDMAGSGIPAKFLAYTWREVGSYSLQDTVKGSTTFYANAECPDDIPENQWISIAKICWQNTKVARDLIGIDEFNKMRAIVFVKQFPAERKLLSWMSDGSVHGRRDYETLTQMYTPGNIMAMNQDLKAITEETGQDLAFRVKSSNKTTWTKVDGWRGKKPARNAGSMRQEDKIKTLFGKGLLKTPKVESLDKWYNHEGDEIKGHLFLEKHIIIAKTATALNETDPQFAMHVSPNRPVAGRWDKYHWSSLTEHQQYGPVLGLVVHKRKGGYEAAVKHFQDLGYTVIEGEEPEERVKAKPAAQTTDGTSTPQKKGPPTFPLLRRGANDWIDYGADEIEKPKAYLPVTITAIHSYEWDGKRPSSGLLQAIEKRWPKTVVLHNKQRVPAVERAGAVHIRVLIDKEVDKILGNAERMKKMMLHDYVHEQSSLPAEILAIPEMQKMFGIPYLRTAEVERFSQDRFFLKMVRDERWSEISYETRRKVKEALSYKAYTDDAFSVARKMCSNTSIFDERELRSLVLGKKPGEVKMLMQKIARLLRTL